MANDKTRGKPASRRQFLTGAAATGAGVVVAGRAVAGTGTGDPLITEVQDWASGLGEGVDAAPYGLPTVHESGVIRRNIPWLTNTTTSSLNFTPIHALEGTITPAGIAFERHHSGAIDLAKPDYRLMVNGMVDRPLVFTFADLERFPRVTATHFCECVGNTAFEWRRAQFNGVQYTHGLMHNMEYTGVPLRLLLEEAGHDPSAKWIYVEGADASSNGRSIPLSKALDDVLVAFKANGEALRREHGYPARLVVPGWEGNLWIKWLRRIEVLDAPVEAREETSKYTDLLDDGRARKWTWVLDAKSVITAPSPEMPVTHGPGPMVITGLAWSGRGAITQVDVSMDGGRNWQVARLSGPSGDKTMTRFYLDTHWDGSEMLLQSRARDNTGYVQPTKDQLRSLRGVKSFYHNNAIQTWWVNRRGEVENVEIS